MQILPLSDVLGARVTGVDLSLPLEHATFVRIEATLHEYCFVVLPRQQLSPRQFVDFAVHWGRPEPHVIDTFHHPDDADILVLSNVVRDGKPQGLPTPEPISTPTIRTLRYRRAAPCCTRCGCPQETTAPLSPTSVWPTMICRPR